MLHLHSITGRIAIGKTIGFIVGVIVMSFLPSFGIPVFSMFGFGTMLMLVLMGATTGFMGMFDRHPALGFKTPWWISGPFVGAFFMLMYVLFTYETLELMIASDLISWMGLTSPFWALLDGIIIGGVMGFVESKFAGEGPKLPVS